MRNNDQRLLTGTLRIFYDSINFTIILRFSYLNLCTHGSTCPLFESLYYAVFDSTLI